LHDTSQETTPRYDLRAERDACGIGFVADVRGRPSRDMIDTAIHSLCRVRHRGALAADAKTGDGAGLLVPLPRPFFARELRKLIPGTPEPAPGLGEPQGGSEWGPESGPAFIGVAMIFVWPDESPGFSEGAGHRAVVEKACRTEGIDVLAWRTVPVDPEALGDRAKRSMPLIEQALILRPVGVTIAEAERRSVRARKHSEKGCRDERIKVYFPSFSFLTITYKGLCVAEQIPAFYPDLADEHFTAPFAIFHQRFSTNTTPTWERAQPFRMMCHNGEINTIQGNVNSMRAREGRLGKVNLLEEELLRPVIDERGSDSAMLDNAIELLTREGRDVRHAVAMLCPAAWEALDDVDDEVRDFYRYHACLVEPWDGPAGIVFTDGIRVGASLDRNGLRPLRYVVCEDGLVACGSEAGSVYTRGRGRVKRGKLGPGQMICVDPTDGGFEEDPVRTRLSRRKPYSAWLTEHLRPASVGEPAVTIPDDLVQRQVAFGYTREDFTTILRPAASTGHEPTFSMGDDTPLSVISDHARPLYTYFKQRFAQVTNPAIDPLRERTVMSIRTLLGPHDPILWERPEGAAMIELDTFLLFKPIGGYPLDATFPVAEGSKGMVAQLERIAEEAQGAARLGSGILLLSDTGIGPERAPIPMLAAVGAVHHALLRNGHRTRTSIVVESDEVRDAHHFACLLGYGADAICPRLTLASIAEIVGRGRLGEDIPVAEALMRYRQAVEEAVLKILSKMGISTTDSYRGAQIFDIVGLSQEVVDRCFAGTHSPVGGVGFAEIAEDVLGRQHAAYPTDVADVAEVAEEAAELREFVATVRAAPRPGHVAWALERFWMGCARPLVQESLSDHLLALRALLDATTETGRASLSLRLAALCAEDGERRAVQRRVELALSLERFLMTGRHRDDLGDWIGSESPRALAADVERYARALLRDVLCGYLEPDLAGLADDILLEAFEPQARGPTTAPRPQVPPEVRAREMRFRRETVELDAVEPEPEAAAPPEPAGSDEPDPEPAVAPAPAPGPPEGVTPSADWDDYSAPV
jgi:glutamate synthase domain-containing protein 1